MSGPLTIRPSPSRAVKSFATAPGRGCIWRARSRVSPKGRIDAEGFRRMKPPLPGGCLCGALRYEIANAPSMAYPCHCTDCQHLTSSAFSLAITVQDSAFQLTKGEPRLLQKIAERSEERRVGKEW